jgi:general secretion pathway protein D
MKKIGLLLIIMLFLWGCVSFSQNYKAGTRAAMNKDWKKAVDLLEKATLEDPTNSVYRLALLRAKIAASLSHLNQARNLAAAGKKDEALEEYAKSLSYDPNNIRILEEARFLRGEEVEKKEEKVTKIEPPIKLLTKDEPIQLSIKRQASLRSIFEALGKHAGINILFDESFKDKPFTIDLTDLKFEQAIKSLCMATKNFSRIIDEKTIIIVPDMPQNRIKYELNAIRTFYLSNINAQDILSALMPLLRTQMKAPVVSVDKNLNSVTVKDSPEVIELAAKLIDLWDKPKAEVVLELEIMEVMRMRLKDYGISLDQNMIGMRRTPETTASDGTTTTGSEGWFSLDRILNKETGPYQVTIPTALLEFMEQDTDTKFLAQPRLRGVDGEEITYLVGDEVPIPQTTFNPIAAGGISSQPITSFQYKPVGIDIKITPIVHHEKEVTLTLEIKIKTLGGTGYGDLPIISTREIKNVIRLKEGETNLLAGLLKDEERKTKKGIIGLKNLPLLGDLFSNTDSQIQQTDVVLTITPHIVRSFPLTEKDKKPLWVGLDTTAAGASSGIQSRRDRVVERARRGIPQAATGQERPGAEPRQSRLSLSPRNWEGPQNRDIRVNVNISTSAEIGNMSTNIMFDPQLLNLKNITMGGFVQQFGGNPSFLKNIDNASGTCTIGFSSPDVSKGFKGGGRIATLIFSTKAKGEATISLAGVSANAPTGEPVNFETQDSRVRIR